MISNCLDIAREFIKPPREVIQYRLIKELISIHSIVALKVIMAGIPLVPVERVAGAVFRAATDKDPETIGAAYTLPDDRQVYLIKDTNIDEGVYGMLTERVKRIRR